VVAHPGHEEVGEHRRDKHEKETDGRYDYGSGNNSTQDESDKARPRVATLISSEVQIVDASKYEAEA
jgi:hypothetical protein